MKTIALVPYLHPSVTMMVIPHMRRITFAVLAMAGRMTMLGIDRWTDDGGYHMVRRSFATTINICISIIPVRPTKFRPSFVPDSSQTEFV